MSFYQTESTASEAKTGDESVDIDNKGAGGEETNQADLDAQKLIDDQKIADDQKLLDDQKLIDDQKLADDNAAKLLENETEEEKAKRVETETAAEKEKSDLKAQIRKEYLAELGYESEDDFVAFKNKVAEKPKTEEEKAAELDTYNKDLTAYAIKSGKLSTKDISEIETIRGMADQDIAMRDFAAEYRAENKDRSADDPITQDEIESAFNTFYHIDSENAVLKGRGERLIKEAADKIKGNTEAKLATAKTEFDITLDKNKNIPLYESFVKTNVKKFIPDHLVVSGEGEPEVVFQLKDDKGNPRYDLKEIEALFVDDKMFQKFVKGGDLKDLEGSIKDNVIAFLEIKNKAAIRTLLLQQGESIGLKKGSTTGSKVPFSATAAKPVETSDKVATPEQQKNMQRYSGLSTRR